MESIGSSTTPEMESSTAPSLESTASQELKQKSTDVGWEYATLINPNKLDKVKCILCDKPMSGGINRLKQHIAQITGNVTPCPKASMVDQIKCRNALLATKTKKKGKVDEDNSLRRGVNICSIDDSIDLDELEGSFGTLKEPHSFGPMDRFAEVTKSDEVLSKAKGKKKVQEDLSSLVRKEKLNHTKEYICRWAYENAIPFHAFERDSFKLMLEAVGQFGPRAQPPTRYELSDTYLKKEVGRTQGLMKRYEDEWKLTGCSIMTDAWSDRKRRSIMNLCVNSKLGTVFLSSKECSDEAHTSEHIFGYVDKCIEDVGEENIVQVVTDNASNNMGAAKLLKEKRPKIFWTSCATHTINLMLEAIGGLPRYKKTLDQAKKLTVFIYALHKTLALMRKFTKKRDIMRPGVTRFALAFLTLQSLAEKKSQLRHMFSSEEWDTCKFSNSVKGKSAYAVVMSASFWQGVTSCLKVFAPLVKVLRMVDADWKPSMGFIYGELQKAIKDIMGALNDNKKLYEPVIEIVNAKMKDRLDSVLHLAAYIFFPYYLYNNVEVQNGILATETLVSVVETLFPGEERMINEIVTVEFPTYKSKLGKFDRPSAIKGCEVNDDRFDPANWWGAYGGSSPHLRSIAMRIFSLTTSSSGCERNWSTFEGVHTKKRNRLDATRLNNLVFVQFNANLMEKNRKRKERGVEVLLAKEATEAQDWIVDDGDVDELEPGLSFDTIGEVAGADDFLEPRRSAITRELFDEEFKSEEEEVNEEVEDDCESDGVQIIEQYGED